MEVGKPNLGAWRRHLPVRTGPRCTPKGEVQALFDSLGGILKAAEHEQGELRMKRSRVFCFAACRGGGRPVEVLIIRRGPSA